MERKGEREGGREGGSLIMMGRRTGSRGADQIASIMAKVKKLGIFFFKSHLCTRNPKWCKGVNIDHFSLRTFFGGYWGSY